MELQKELEKLNALFNAVNEKEFEQQSDFINANFTSAEEKQQIADFTKKLFSEFSSNLDEKVTELTARVQLAKVMNIISVSYIAKKYFNHTRGWLTNKINGNLNNGKPVYFTPAEKLQMNYALQDISRTIGSVNLV